MELLAVPRRLSDEVVLLSVRSLGDSLGDEIASWFADTLLGLGAGSQSDGNADGEQTAMVTAVSHSSA